MSSLPESKYDENGRLVKGGIGSLFSFSKRDPHFRNGESEGERRLKVKSVRGRLNDFEGGGGEVSSSRVDVLPIVMGFASVFVYFVGIFFALYVLINYSKGKLGRELNGYEKFGRLLSMVGLFWNFITLFFVGVLIVAGVMGGV